MNDEKEGVIESVLSTIKSRVGNPLIGSFIISWIIINWRFLGILLTGDEQMLLKIRMLEIEYMPASRMIFLPLLAAFIWALWYPHVDNFIDEKRRAPIRKKELRRIHDEIEDIRLRKERTQETTALIIEEKKAANFGFSDYRQSELDYAKADVEFAEQKIKDVGEKQRALGNSHELDFELQTAYSERDDARANLNVLRKQIEAERLQKAQS